jgi:hypothetical protein
VVAAARRERMRGRGAHLLCITKDWSAAAAATAAVTVHDDATDTRRDSTRLKHALFDLLSHNTGYCCTADLSAVWNSPLPRPLLLSCCHGLLLTASPSGP